MRSHGASVAVGDAEAPVVPAKQDDVARGEALAADDQSRAFDDARRPRAPRGRAVQLPHVARRSAIMIASGAPPAASQSSTIWRADLRRVRGERHATVLAVGTECGVDARRGAAREALALPARAAGAGSPRARWREAGRRDRGSAAGLELGKLAVVAGRARASRRPRATRSSSSCELARGQHPGLVDDHHRARRERLAADAEPMQQRRDARGRDARARPRARARHGGDRRAGHRDARSPPTPRGRLAARRSCPRRPGRATTRHAIASECEPAHHRLLLGRERRGRARLRSDRSSATATPHRGSRRRAASTIALLELEVLDVEYRRSSWRE